MWSGSVEVNMRGTLQLQVDLKSSTISVMEDLTIGQIAERSGVSTSALRYYEEQGLVFPHRTDGNQRRFPRTTLRRIAVIRAAQRFGLSLEEIKAALDEIPNDRTPSKTDWERLSRHWRARLDTEIMRLENLRDQADLCIGCGCLSLDACGLFNPADALAERGQGAHRLERPSR